MELFLSARVVLVGIVVHMLLPRDFMKNTAAHNTLSTLREGIGANDLVPPEYCEEVWLNNHGREPMDHHLSPLLPFQMVSFIHSF